MSKLLDECPAEGLVGCWLIKLALLGKGAELISDARLRAIETVALAEFVPPGPTPTTV